jgi:site-specific recombinase XerD
MTDLIVVPQQTQWHKLKALVLDSVSSPITKRVYNLGLDEFFAWFGQEPRPGFTKATVSAWRVALEARGLGAVSISVRITAVRKLAVEAADNGLLAPELASGITRVKGVASKGVRLGNWLTVKQAQTLLKTPDASTTKGLRDRAILAVLLGCGLRRSESAGSADVRTRPAAGWSLVHRRSRRKARARADDSYAGVDQSGNRCVDHGGGNFRRPGIPSGESRRSGPRNPALNEKVVWQLLQRYTAVAGVPGIAPHDLRRTCAKLCRASGGELEQIQLLLGHASVQTTERYLGTKQDLVYTPNDGIKLRVTV